MSAICRILISCLCLLLFSGCTTSPDKDLLLYGFEEDASLDALSWRCKTLYTISSEHATQGKHSLKVEMYPADYSGFYPKLKVTDWRGYHALKISVTNPDPEDLPMTLRLDDTQSSEYGDRCNRAIVLKPGRTDIVVSLSDLKVSSGERSMNIKHIKTFMLFASALQRRRIVYVDGITLVVAQAGEGT